MDPPQPARAALAEDAASPRTPAGAAVLQPDVTAALLAAAAAELNAHGYGRLSLENVARRAGVGKPALYRRWKSKAELVTAVVVGASVREFPDIDTGDLYSDLLLNLQRTRALMTDPGASRILPDLIAEVARSPELAEVWLDRLVVGRRRIGRIMLERAQGRGELLADLDMELALDFMISPLYWRLSVTRGATDEGYLERLAAWIHATLTANGRIAAPG